MSDALFEATSTEAPTIQRTKMQFKHCKFLCSAANWMYTFMGVGSWSSWGPRKSAVFECPAGTRPIGIRARPGCYALTSVQASQSQQCNTDCNGSPRAGTIFCSTSIGRPATMRIPAIFWACHCSHLLLHI